MSHPLPPERRNVAEMRAVRPVVWPAYAVAAIALVIAIVVLGFNLSIGADRTRMRTDLLARTARDEALMHELALERLATADLISPLSKRFPVEDGEVVVSHEGRIYVAMSALPPLNEGMVYRVWTARPNSSTMTPSVSFVPNRNGVAVVPLPVPASAVATLAIDREPEGDRKARMGTPLFVVSLQ